MNEIYAKPQHVCFFLFGKHGSFITILSGCMTVMKTNKQKASYPSFSGYETTELHLSMNTLNAKDFICANNKNLHVTNCMSGDLSCNVPVKKDSQKYHPE